MNNTIVTILLYLAIISSIIMSFFIVWIIYKVFKAKQPIIFPESDPTNNKIR